MRLFLIVPMLITFESIKLPKQLSSRLLIVILIQVLLVSFGVGIFSFLAGLRFKQLQAVGYQQQGALTALTLGLSNQLKAPKQLNALNAVAIAQGDLSVDNFSELSKRFWNQLQQFPVGYINFGGVNGEFVGVERLSNGGFLLHENTNIPGPGKLFTYSMGPLGEKQKFIRVISGMSKYHEEPWYVETVAAGRPIWSSVYQWEDDESVFAISFNQPVFSTSGKLLGVIGVDFILSQLSTWMQSVWQTNGGLALIVDSGGYLIASSDQSFLLKKVGTKLIRQRIDKVDNALVQKAANIFFSSGEFNSGRITLKNNALNKPPQQILSANSNGVSLLDAARWGNELGLNWTLVTVFETRPTFWDHNNSYFILVFSAILLGLFIWLSLRWIIFWLLLPLQYLRSQSELIGAFLRSKQPIAPVICSQNEPIEIQSLALSIADLIESFNNQLLLIAEQNEREAIKDAQSIAILRDKLKTSLRAAAIAHEINQPLSSILLNTNMLLQSNPLDSGIRMLNTHAFEISETIEKMRSLLSSIQSKQEVINLSSVVASILIYAKSNLSKLSAFLLFTESAERFWIMGDPAQIQIAVINLLRNSLAAVEMVDSDSPVVEIKLFSRGEFVVLLIADSGCGFTEYQLDNLLLSSSTEKGTGLGLFLVQCTMENHNGLIELDSSLYGGAQVGLLFPLLAAPSSGYS